MSIEWLNGDLLADPADALVCPVNGVGVMGKGLALAFKRKFPELNRAYRSACSNGLMLPGMVVDFLMADGTIVYCVATKGDWRKPSAIEWVDDGLFRLAGHINTTPISSVAVPSLGCGLGGLRFNDVKPLIEKHLGGLEAEVRVYTPQETR